MINKVIILGNVGRDPEVRYFENDQAVANFSIATTDRAFKTRDGQEIPEKTEWHNIVAWRGLAKLAENYIKKGSQIYVEGKLRTRSYDDANGVKKYTTEIVAEVIQLLGRKPSAEGEPSYSAAQAPAAQPSANSNIQSQPVYTPSATADDNFLKGGAEVEDDLPF